MRRKNPYKDLDGMTVKLHGPPKAYKPKEELRPYYASEEITEKVAAILEENGGIRESKYKVAFYEDCLAGWPMKESRIYNLWTAKWSRNPSSHATIKTAARWREVEENIFEIGKARRLWIPPSNIGYVEDWAKPQVTPPRPVEAVQEEGVPTHLRMDGAN